MTLFSDIADVLKKNIGKPKDTPSVYFPYNYPVQLHRDEETGEVHWHNYMPRKSRVEEVEEPLQEEEITNVCNGMITVLKNAIILYEMFRDGKIDSVYYWDLDSWAYKTAEEIDALVNAKKEK